MTLHHPVNVHHHFKGTWCLHVLLIDSITSNNTNAALRQSVPGLRSFLKYCYSVIIHGTGEITFKDNAHLNSLQFNSAFPFHSQTPTVYDSAQLQTLKQLFPKNIKLRGTRRREMKWQEGGENCRMSSLTGFTLHTIRWGGGEMLENINKGKHLEDTGG